MGEMAYLWGYDEEMGQKLLYTTLELEKLKEEAVEELSKNKEHMKQLIRLLKCAVQERDEARNQLHKLLLNQNQNQKQNQPTPLFLDALAPSVITECSSPSDAYNSVDSLFQCVPSPATMPAVAVGVGLIDHPDVVFANNQQPTVQQDQDEGSLIIDSIVKGRVLPEKGKFREAMESAGPLLETLMKAGPGTGTGQLPQWRYPPQIQNLQIPPVPISPCYHIGSFSQKPGISVGHMGLKSFNLQPYGQMSPFNFSNSNGIGNMSSGVNCGGGYDSLAKRPRLI